MRGRRDHDLATSRREQQVSRARLDLARSGPRFKSISRPNLQYTFRKDTPYDMLVALKDRYAPSDTTRIRELKVKYEELKSSTPNALTTKSRRYRRMVKREQADLSFATFKGQSDLTSSPPPLPRTRSHGTIGIRITIPQNEGNVFVIRSNEVEKCGRICSEEEARG